MMNKSLESEKMRLMKQFNRKTRVSRQFRTLSQTPRDHPVHTNLPSLVRDRVTLDSHKSQIKDMMKSLMITPSSRRKQHTSPVQNPTREEKTFLEKLGLIDPTNTQGNTQRSQTSILNAKQSKSGMRKRIDKINSSRDEINNVSPGQYSNIQYYSIILTKKSLLGVVQY